MQLKQRIKKLERRTGATENFCRCGTPYFVTFVIGGENVVNNVCPECGRDVKMQTPAEFAINAHKYEYKVIEPKASFNRAQFEEWQNKHVVSKHISYEQFLAEQNAE